MRVFRRRQTLGFLALLAVAMQGLLAFAHTHVHSPAALRSASLATRAITYGMCRADAERPCPPPARKDDHAGCSLCLAMSLGAAAVLQSPPTLPFAHQPMDLRAPVLATARTQGGESFHFQARAPPRVIEA